MSETITPSKIKRLRKKMGSYAALAVHLTVTEMTIRRWEKGNPDINGTGYRFEVDRLLTEYGIN